MALYVTDTHPLIWYATGRRAKLSTRAARIFDHATRGRALIYVPALVIWEIALLARRGRIIAGEPIGKWASRLVAQAGFDLVPLDLEIINEATTLPLVKDPFDAAIVATARLKDVPLLTRDHEIIVSRLVDVIW